MQIDKYLKNVLKLGKYVSDVDKEKGFPSSNKKYTIFDVYDETYETSDNIVRRKDCLKEFERMETAQDRINKKAVESLHYFEHIKFS